MFLVQTALWLVQFSVLAYYGRYIYLSLKHNYSHEDGFDIIDILEYVIKFGACSAVIQFAIAVCTKLVLHMN